MKTILKPYDNHIKNHIKTTLKAYQNHIKTILKPYKNHTQTIQKPYWNQITTALNNNSLTQQKKPHKNNRKNIAETHIKKYKTIASACTNHIKNTLKP